MSNPNEALLRDLVTASRILANEKIVDSFGHVSVRNPENAGRLCLSRACSGTRHARRRR